MAACRVTVPDVAIIAVLDCRMEIKSFDPSIILTSYPSAKDLIKGRREGAATDVYTIMLLFYEDIILLTLFVIIAFLPENIGF